jgi:hypothetical protein
VGRRARERFEQALAIAEARLTKCTADFLQPSERRVITNRPTSRLREASTGSSEQKNSQPPRTLSVRIRHSKTDQAGEGAVVAILPGSFADTCSGPPILSA